MKKYIVFGIIVSILLVQFVLAELKPSYNIPKRLTAEEMKDAPKLSENSVYPGWGVACTKFTYRVVYQDDKGREPEYVRINLNNKWYDMTKKRGNYKTGALYTYEYIPTSTKSNFFYFEASNGVGKTRAAIIDSPDQGPTIYSEKFDNNQIILLDKNGKELWTYDTRKDQVEGVAISKDGNYVAAVTNYHIYLFSKDSKESLWKFCTQCKVPAFVSGNMAGIAISADGNYIAATLQSTLYLFNKESNQLLWTRNIESSGIGVDMSDDASVIAVGTSNAGIKGDKILLFDKEGNKLGEYRASHPGYEQTGNFYQPDVTPDGKYVAVSTGCPDRRAYLFSGDGDLIFRSEQLTFDSPVHKSSISDDGSLIAYSADHGQGQEIVFLYDNKGKKLWSFSSQEDGTARGVSISADGNYIAAGTTGGHVYLFSKNSNKPLWKFAESNHIQIGEVVLNTDGSLLAAAGTSKKIYLFSQTSNRPLWEYKANTWITKLDFNGEYIVAGTGLREYMGEGITEEKEFTCKEIIEPPAMEETEGGQFEGIYSEGEITKQPSETFCGNNLCESPAESYENCPQDCCGEDCENDLDEKREGGGKDSNCAQFDHNERECLAHSEKCIWISGEDICESLSEVGVEKEKIEEEPKSEEIEKEKKSLFRAIINFFRRLFGK